MRSNISAWSPLHKTTNTICTAPDYACCTLLNIIPWRYGVSNELSPETIMTGSPPPDYNKLKIGFSSYAQVFNAISPFTTPRSRTHGAIALGATENAGGAFYFLSLASGEILSHHKWTVCPIQEAVIKS